MRILHKPENRFFVPLLKIFFWTGEVGNVQIQVELGVDLGEVFLDFIVPAHVLKVDERIPKVPFAFLDAAEFALAPRLVENMERIMQEALVLAAYADALLGEAQSFLIETGKPFPIRQIEDDEGQPLGYQASIHLSGLVVVLEEFEYQNRSFVVAKLVF